MEMLIIKIAIFNILMLLLFIYKLKKDNKYESKNKNEVTIILMSRLNS